MSVVLAYASDEPTPDDVAWIGAATRNAATAGPDAQRVQIVGAAGLAHAALWTSLDHPSPQPLTLDERVWLSADVRLDDRDALAHSLRAAGRTFPCDADDARLLLEAYHAWGDGCLDRIAGDFAFALWDASRRRMLLARDQLGVNPLYYATTARGMIVSTALDAVRRHDAVRDTLDDGAVGDLLIAGHVIDPHATIYADVRQVPAAHALTWHDGTVTLRRYWSPPAWDGFERLGTARDYAERFRDVLQTAVADRARAPRVGVQLSGGLDSTSVAALADRARRAMRAPFAMRAYTVSLDGVMADRESEYAVLVAAHLGMPLERIDMLACPDVDPLDVPPVQTPQPTPFRRTGLELELARRPAAYARVVLTGLGGDVLLGCSPAYWLNWLARGQVRRTVRSVTEHVRLFGRLPVPGVRSALRHRALLARGVGGGLASWIARDFARRTDLDARRRAYERAALESNDAVGMASTFWSEMFANGHPAATGIPVRFRHPLFDLRLVALATALPPRPWLVRKRILRDATAGLLPDAVRQRPKTALVEAPNEALRERRGVQGSLLTMIERTPELTRFVDIAALSATVRGDGALDPRHARAHVAALGLAHWLYHRRPAGTGAEQGHAAPNTVGAHVDAVPLPPREAA